MSFRRCRQFLLHALNHGALNHGALNHGALNHVRRRASISSQTRIGHSRPLHLESLEERRLLAVVTVNDYRDKDDVFPTATISDLPGKDGMISLREAIIATNNSAGTDQIQIATGVRDEIDLRNHEGRGEDASLMDDLDITDHLTVRDNEVSETTITQWKDDRVLNILPSANVRFVGVTNVHGRGVESGAGTYNSVSGNVTLIDSSVKQNVADLAVGGIYNGSGRFNSSDAEFPASAPVSAFPDPDSAFPDAFHENTTALGEPNATFSTRYDSARGGVFIDVELSGFVIPDGSARAFFTFYQEDELVPLDIFTEFAEAEYQVGVSPSCSFYRPGGLDAGTYDVEVYIQETSTYFRVPFIVPTSSPALFTSWQVVSNDLDVLTGRRDYVMEFFGVPAGIASFTVDAVTDINGDGYWDGDSAGFSCSPKAVGSSTFECVGSIDPICIVETDGNGCDDGGNHTYNFFVNSAIDLNHSLFGQFYRLSRWQEGQYFGNLNYEAGNLLQDFIDIDTFTVVDYEECRYEDLIFCFESGYYFKWLEEYFAGFSQMMNQQGRFEITTAGNTATVDAHVPLLPVGDHGFLARLAYWPVSNPDSKTILPLNCTPSGCDLVEVNSLNTEPYVFELQLFDDHPFVNVFGISGSQSFQHDWGQDVKASVSQVVSIVASAPTVASVEINDGALQRSRINDVKVFFGSLVDVPEYAFSIKNIDTNTPLVNLSVSIEDVDSSTVATITFENEGILADGNYRLDIGAALVTDRQSNLSMGADFQFGAVASDKFFRLYGDVDADRNVDFSDFASGVLPAFGTTLGNPNFKSELDYDQDGDVDFFDFNYGFLPNFGTSRELT